MFVRRTGGLAAAAFVVLVAARCGGDGGDGNLVTVDYNDGSPPRVTLDAYNLPVQSGANSQPAAGNHQY